MLPKQYKISSSREFADCVKNGRRGGSRTVVVYAARWEDLPNAPIAHLGGPRFGLIVSKSVGNAVVRHRVSRRLRHICLNLVDDCDASEVLVLRALPKAAEVTSGRLERDVRYALGKARRR